MVTNISHSHETEVGQVFTPPRWAEWLIARWGIFDAWVDGASVCDPTAGQGAFALVLFRVAKSRKIQISTELLSRLTLIEVSPFHLHAFKLKAGEDFEVDFPLSQLLPLDVVTDTPAVKYDILCGNPPWSNFADLPDPDKEKFKPCFLKEGLLPDKRQALLGSSRVDMAALVLKVVLGKLLRRGGIGCFYVPSSLFCGGNAHRGFRDYTANRRKFRVDEVYEFTRTGVFEGIATSYCCARFQMDTPHRFPVRYFKETGSGWEEHRAISLKLPGDQWRILRNGGSAALETPIENPLSSINRLVSRKGVLIRSFIDRGIWWDLLGVGPYSFAPYKVIWEAYGKSCFEPVILDGRNGQEWQANQSMHAFIPCWGENQAKHVHSALRHPGIPVLLEELNGKGKCNWAQPGKIEQILSLGDAEYCQPLLPFDKEATE